MITAIAMLFASAADASSHREAPAIALDPSADLTDLYMFVEGDKLVLIMNSNPLEEPGGGPNFYRFDDNVLYEIHIDNEGDAEADITYQFRVSTTYQLPNTFLYNVGDITDPMNLNMIQTYTVNMVADGVSTTILTTGTVAPINVGVASSTDGSYTPKMAAPGTITTSHIEAQGDYRFFAGPRQEGFYIDLENTFDLLNLGNGGFLNSLLGKNVHSMAIEVPLSSVTLDGATPDVGAQNNVIAAWSTTSRKAAVIRRSDGVGTAHRGDWVQVSRLGNPLVNEVVLPISMKDMFNAAHPRNDTQFLGPVQYSELAGLLNAFLGTSCPLVADQGLADASGFDGRDDLVLAFLTGYPGINQWPGFALGGPIPGEPAKLYAPYEALRIDLTTPGGWPNGRLVGEDVADTALSAVCGLLVDGTLLPDGVDSTGLSYLTTFPYLGDPWAGNDHPDGGHDLP
ncbi:MAG: DUF4331 domain-containing protein [Deltaproteobacteria bacterium]|nr:DUF4331 domain-containing protein [Deltaproteobacteria bacterium]